ncbi:MAG: DUF1015 family protein [Thermoplasmata archaeon]
MNVSGFSPYVFSGNVGEFVSPPTDMMSKNEINTLYSKRNNVTRLTFGNDPAGILKEMIDSGKITKINNDSMLILKQKFMQNGKLATRIGLICSLNLGNGDDQLVPHESTIREYVEQRKKFLRKTEAQTEPVFIVVPGAEIESYLLKFSEGFEQLFSFIDSASVENTVYLLNERSKMQEISRFLGEFRGIIADGHHRVKALTEINREREENGQMSLPLFSYITSLDSPSMSITGVHRIIRNGSDNVLKRINSGFKVNRLETSRLDGNVVLYDGNYNEIVPLPDTLKLIRARGAYPETPADYSRFAMRGQSMEVDNVYDGDEIDYTPYEIRAVEEVDKGDAKAALLMPPWKKDIFTSVVSSGRILPPKSTFFSPKIFAGIALSIEEEGTDFRR